MFGGQTPGKSSPMKSPFAGGMDIMRWVEGDVEFHCAIFQINPQIEDGEKKRYTEQMSEITSDDNLLVQAEDRSWNKDTLNIFLSWLELKEPKKDSEKTVDDLEF